MCVRGMLMTVRRLLLPLFAIAAVAGSATLLSARQTPGRPPATAPLADKIPADPSITTGQFPNGLRYYVRRERASPRTAPSCGSWSTPARCSRTTTSAGLAHFVEHMAFNGTKHFPKQDIVEFMQSIGMRFGADVNALHEVRRDRLQARGPDRQAGRCSTARCSILEDWARNVTLRSGRDRQGARRRHGGVAARPRRGRRDCRTRSSRCCCTDSRYADAPADRQARDHPERQPRRLTHVLQGLVPAGPDGGDRGRRLRRGGRARV